MRGPIELFKASFSGIKQNLGLYVGILLVLGVTTLLTSFLDPVRGSGFSGAGKEIIYLVAVLLQMLISVLTAVSLILGFAGRASGVGEAFRQAMPFFWRYIGLSIVLSVIIVLGYILLFVPGVIFSVWFLFAGFVLVLEGAGIKDSIMRSREYVKGKWWGVFGRALALLVASLLVLPAFSIIALILPANGLLIGLLNTVGSLLVTVVGIGYFYNMYLDVKGGGNEMSDTPTVAATPDYGGGAV